MAPRGVVLLALAGVGSAKRCDVFHIPGKGGMCAPAIFVPAVRAATALQPTPCRHLLPAGAALLGLRRPFRPHSPRAPSPCRHCFYSPQRHVHGPYPPTPGSFQLRRVIPATS